VAVHKEQVPVPALQEYLRRRGAVFHPDRSTERAHIYEAAAMKKWLKIYRIAPTVVVVEYHNTCPCSSM
jgi:GTP cyclohydrolase FolE2